MGFLVCWRNAVPRALFGMDSLVFSSAVYSFFRDLRSGLEMARTQILSDPSSFFNSKRIDRVGACKHIHVCMGRLRQCLLGSSLCHFFNVNLLRDIPNAISDWKKRWKRKQFHNKNA